MKMNKSKIIFLVGISGSGKTTWATSYLQIRLRTVRICRNDIRKTLMAKLTPEYYKRPDLFQIETLVSRVEKSMYEHAVALGRDVLIDNPNLKQAHIEEWLKLTEEFQFELKDCDPLLAKQRLAIRDLECDYHYLPPDDKSKLDYVDKQAEDYEVVKKWIKDKYPEKIMR